MTRSSKSSSSASVNSASSGRTTVKYLTVILVNDEFQDSVSGNVKGTSVGNLYASLRKTLQEQGKSIPSTTPNPVKGFESKQGIVTMRYILLISWKQCPMCGALQSAPTSKCPKCAESLELSKQDIADWKESGK